MSESKWISVKERLPEVGAWVLVAIRDGKLPTVAEYRPVEYSCDWRPDCEFILGYDYDTDFMDVTHWQPLPLPPGEEESK